MAAGRKMSFNDAEETQPEVDRPAVAKAEPRVRESVAAINPNWKECTQLSAPGNIVYVTKIRKGVLVMVDKSITFVAGADLDVSDGNRIV